MLPLAIHCHTHSTLCYSSSKIWLLSNSKNAYTYMYMCICLSTHTVLSRANAHPRTRAHPPILTVLWFVRSFVNRPPCNLWYCVIPCVHATVFHMEMLTFILSNGWNGRSSFTNQSLGYKATILYRWFQGASSGDCAERSDTLCTLWLRVSRSGSWGWALARK